MKKYRSCTFLNYRQTINSKIQMNTIKMKKFKHKEIINRYKQTNLNIHKQK